MTRRYIPEPTTERVDLGDGDFVDIKVGIPWGDVLDLYDDTKMTTGSARTRQALEGIIRLGIAGWSGPGFEGLPFSPEAIARLRMDDATRLGQLVSDKNPDMVTSPKGQPAPGSTSSAAERPA